MGDGNTWLHLGEVTKGYEPIVLRDGKFLIVNPAFHSLPVLRVTAYGASAYARFYGRRLPTEVQWFRAMTGKDKPLGESTSLPHESSDMETMHRRMMDRSSVAQQAPTKHTIPVTDFEPNMYGIRGLGGNISEWALVSVKGSSPAKETQQYLVLPTVLSRHPFEGFENVGFRCVLSVPSKKD